MIIYNKNNNNVNKYRKVKQQILQNYKIMLNNYKMKKNMIVLNN